VSEHTPSVLIIGNGVAALLAAIAIARRLPHVKVLRLATDGHDLFEESFGAARPSIRAFHGLTGIDEAEIVARTRSGYRLGTRIEGWSRLPYLRCHGMCGEPIGNVPFHALWLRTRASGTLSPYDSFSIAAQLAARERFDLPSSERASPLGALDYGLQLHLPGYRQALQALARAAGVQEVSGTLGAVELSGERSLIVALQLADGRRLVADLFVDASGREAVLRRQLPRTWVDWSAALPIDRLIVAREAPDRAPPPSDRLFALPAGWRYEAFTPAETLRVLGYASAELPDDEARAIMGPAQGCEVRHDPIVLKQGRLTQPWIGNCVAIGAAAVTLEPSGATVLHTVCRHIERLIAYWPGRACTATPVEIDLFNRRTALEAERMRDFVQLPYLLCDRPEAFWRRAAHAPVSQELTRDLALFRERGRLGMYEEDGFERDEWLTTFISHGVVPRRADPLTDAVPPALAEQRITAMAARLAQTVERTPSHAQRLARLADLRR
jgi:tryptophan halogenase